jgi:hypothetical protein
LCFIDGFSYELLSNIFIAFMIHIAHEDKEEDDDNDYDNHHHHHHYHNVALLRL